MALKGRQALIKDRDLEMLVRNLLMKGKMLASSIVVIHNAKGQYTVYLRIPPRLRRLVMGKRFRIMVGIGKMEITEDPNGEYSTIKLGSKGNSIGTIYLRIPPITKERKDCFIEVIEEEPLRFRVYF